MALAAVTPACDLLSPCPAELAAPREDAGVVLSAWENAIYWIGGRDGDGLHHDLLRFDVATGQFRRLDLTGATPQRVLAATYRPDDRALYVVDRVGPFPWLELARLLRIDPVTGHSEQLGAWPRSPVRDSTGPSSCGSTAGSRCGGSGRGRGSWSSLRR